MYRRDEDLSRLVLDCSAMPQQPVRLIWYRPLTSPVLAGAHAVADVQMNVGFYVSA